MVLSSGLPSSSPQKRRAVNIQDYILYSAHFGLFHHDESRQVIRRQINEEDHSFMISRREATAERPERMFVQFYSKRDRPIAILNSWHYYDVQKEQFGKWLSVNLQNLKWNMED